MTVKEQLEIIERGTLEIITLDELKEKIRNSLKNKKPLRVKLGIDPTAPDIHLGFAVVLKKLREFQDLNHIAVLIIGDFTAKIGDPSGKKKTRPQLSEKEIKKNMKKYLTQAYKILKKENLEIHYNSSWFKHMDFKKIIQLTSQVTIQQILARDDFKNRLEENYPIHLHEIIYPLMQAYDSFMVKADIELGGSDQRFNCLVGREIQPRYNQEKQIVILMPLLLGIDGKKMSKSYGNYIGINESPREMFGKIMRISDDLMEQWFELCTDLSKEEIKQILIKSHPFEAKKRLALEIVSLYHGIKKAKKAKEEFEKIFQRKEIPSFSGMIEVIRLPLIMKGQPLIDILRETKVFQSNRELREYLEKGAIRMDGEKIFKEEALKTIKKNIILKIGKRKFFKIVFE